MERSLSQDIGRVNHWTDNGGYVEKILGHDAEDRLVSHAETKTLNGFFLACKKTAEHPALFFGYVSN